SPVSPPRQAPASSASAALCTTARIWQRRSNSWRGLLLLDRDKSRQSFIRRQIPLVHAKAGIRQTIGFCRNPGSPLARGRAEALAGPSAFPVHRFRIKDARVAKFELCLAELALGRAERHGAIKTRPSSGMAGAGDLFDLDPNRVLVAIDAHVDDALRVAGGLALFPQRVARATEIPSFAGGNGFRQRLRVHMRDHQ